MGNFAQVNRTASSARLVDYHRTVLPAQLTKLIATDDLVHQR